MIPKESNVTIIQDTREKNPWKFSRSELITDVKVKKLDTGDYSLPGLEKIFTIERKQSVSEIANNITEKRFADVINRLRGFKYKYIICEFDASNISEFPYNCGIPRSKIPYVRIKPAFIFSCLSKIQVDYDIPVIFAGNSQTAEILVENYIKRIIRN